MTAKKAAPQLTAEKETQFCAMLAAGCSARTAADLIDVAESTLRSRMRRDPTFGEKVCKARRTAELLALRNVQNAGEKYWRASAWLLERLRPEEYVARKPRTMTPEETSDVLLEIAELILRHVSHEADRLAVLKAVRNLTEELRRDERPLCGPGSKRPRRARPNQA